MPAPPGSEDRQPGTDPYFRRLEVAPLAALDAGPHFLTVVLDRGAVDVWLDGERALQTIIPNYAPHDAIFGATASQGTLTGNQDVLEMSVRCDLTSFPAGFNARRALAIDRTASSGATVRVPFPNTGGRPDGRGVAVYRGAHPLRAQWEDLAAIDTATAALIVRVPAAGQDDIHVYSARASGTPRLDHRPFALAERFDGELAPGWTDNWGQRCYDRTDVEGKSACILRVGVLTRSIAAPPLAILGSKEVYEVDLFLSGGFPRNDEVFFLAAAAASSRC